MNRKVALGVSIAICSLGLVGPAKCQSVNRPVMVSAVQSALDAYLALPVATRPAQFALPDGIVLCDRPLRLPEGTNNVHLLGTANTRFLRVTSATTPLIQVGSGASFALDNTVMKRLPITVVQPLQAGDTDVQTTTGQSVPSGYYFLFGDDPAPIETNGDIVRGPSNTLYWFKRELVYIDNTTGTSKFSAPIGRDYEFPKLAALDGTVLSPPNRLTSNIILENIELDGRPTDTVDQRFRSPRNFPDRLMEIGSTLNVTLRNIRAKRFTFSGIKISMSRNVTIENTEVSDGNSASFRYGMEVLGCRFVTVRSCSFTEVGHAIATGVGTMDMYVVDSDVAPGSVGYDLSHGQGERNILYQRCIADSFQIGNTVWLRGAENVRMINCSARKQIDVKPNVTNVEIIGKYTDTSTNPPTVMPTAPRIAFYTISSGTSYLPTGIFYPKDVLVQDALFEMNPTNEIQPKPNAGFVLIFYSDGSLQRVGNLRFVNTQFKNLVQTVNRSGTTTLAPTTADANDPTSSISFEQCFFENTNGYSPITTWSSTAAQARHNLTFTDCTFKTVNPGGLAVPRALRFLSGSLGTVTIQNCLFDRNTDTMPMDGSATDTSILNEGGVTVNYLP